MSAPNTTAGFVQTTSAQALNEPSAKPDAVSPVIVNRVMVSSASNLISTSQITTSQASGTSSPATGRPVLPLVYLNVSRGRVAAGSPSAVTVVNPNSPTGGVVLNHVAQVIPANARSSTLVPGLSPKITVGNSSVNSNAAISTSSTVSQVASTGQGSQQATLVAIHAPLRQTNQSGNNNPGVVATTGSSPAQTHFVTISKDSLTDSTIGMTLKPVTTQVQGQAQHYVTIQHPNMPKNTLTSSSAAPGQFLTIRAPLLTASGASSPVGTSGVTPNQFLTIQAPIIQSGASGQPQATFVPLSAGTNQAAKTQHQTLSYLSPVMKNGAIPNLVASSPKVMVQALPVLTKASGTPTFSSVNPSLVTTLASSYSQPSSPSYSSSFATSQQPNVASVPRTSGIATIAVVPQKVTSDSSIQATGPGIIPTVPKITATVLAKGQNATITKTFDLSKVCNNITQDHTTTAAPKATTPTPNVITLTKVDNGSYEASIRTCGTPPSDTNIVNVPRTTGSSTVTRIQPSSVPVKVPTGVEAPTNTITISRVGVPSIKVFPTKDASGTTSTQIEVSSVLAPTSNTSTIASGTTSAHAKVPNALASTANTSTTPKTTVADVTKIKMAANPNVVTISRAGSGAPSGLPKYVSEDNIQTSEVPVAPVKVLSSTSNVITISRPDSFGSVTIAPPEGDTKSDIQKSRKLQKPDSFGSVTIAPAEGDTKSDIQKSRKLQKPDSFGSVTIAPAEGDTKSDIQKLRKLQRPDSFGRVTIAPPEGDSQSDIQMSRNVQKPHLHVTSLPLVSSPEVTVSTDVTVTVTASESPCSPSATSGPVLQIGNDAATDESCSSAVLRVPIESLSRSAVTVRVPINNAPTRPDHPDSTSVTETAASVPVKMTLTPTPVSITSTPPTLVRRDANVRKESLLIRRDFDEVTIQATTRPADSEMKPARNRASLLISKQSPPAPKSLLLDKPKDPDKQMDLNHCLQEAVDDFFSGSPNPASAPQPRIQEKTIIKCGGPNDDEVTLIKVSSDVEETSLKAPASIDHPDDMKIELIKVAPNEEKAPQVELKPVVDEISITVETKPKSAAPAPFSGSITVGPKTLRGTTKILSKHKSLSNIRSPSIIKSQFLNKKGLLLPGGQLTTTLGPRPTSLLKATRKSALEIRPDFPFVPAPKKPSTKDATFKDSISKDTISKDTTCEDATPKKDTVPKDVLSKDAVLNDDTSKDDISKDDTTEDASSMDVTVSDSTSTDVTSKDVTKDVISEDVTSMDITSENTSAKEAAPEKPPEDFDPVSALEWNDGVGLLPGSNLKFRVNEFGLMEMVSDDDKEHEGIKCRRSSQNSDDFGEAEGGSGDDSKDGNPEKDALEDFDDADVKKECRPEDIVRCENCGCYGVAAEFMNSRFCTSNCSEAYAVKKATEIKREMDHRALILRRRRKRMERTRLEKATGAVKKEEEEEEVEDGDEEDERLHHPHSKGHSSIPTPLGSDDDSISVTSNDAAEITKGKIGKAKNAPFVWAKYLETVKAKAAPAKLFKDDNQYTKNKFKIGMKLEGIDPEHPALFCVLTVVEVRGSRLRLHFDGYPDSHDFWVNMDSPEIFPVGWCQKNNRRLTLPRGYTSQNFNWNSYLKACRGFAAPRQLFTKGTASAVCPNGFRIGMKLEAVDRKDASLICVATVADILDNRILVHFDSWDDMYDYWVDPSSPYIHPVGWCKENGYTITPPNHFKEPGQFSWPAYLKQTSSIAAPSRAFKQRPAVGFKRGMRLEAVDKRVPSLIRVATVEEALDHRIMLHFDGWPHVYDYWVDEDSPDIHRAGWCRDTKHPLEPPPTREELNDTSHCITPGCKGDGHIKGPKFASHTSAANCPYALENMNREGVVPDRINPTADSNETSEIPLLKEKGTTLNNTLRIVEGRRPLGRPPKWRRFIDEGDDRRKRRRISDEDEGEKRPSSPFETSKLQLELQQSVFEPGYRIDLGTNRSACWAKHSLPLHTSPMLTDCTDPHKWGPSDVAKFVATVVGLEHKSQVFYDEEIDGEALLLMTQRDLVENLGLKLGPAIKLYNCIVLLRQKKSKGGEPDEVMS